MELKNFTIDSENNIEYTGSKPAIIDFWAEWCAPCRITAPIFKELEKEYGDKIEFIKIDVDEEPELSKQFGIRGIPTFYFVSPNKFVTIQVGVMPKEGFVQIIEEKLLAE